jgi:hypothetical protein
VNNRESCICAFNNSTSYTHQQQQDHPAAVKCTLTATTEDIHLQQQERPATAQFTRQQQQELIAAIYVLYTVYETAQKTRQ